MTALIWLWRGGGEGQTAKLCPVSNCTYVMYNTPVGSSFAYLLFCWRNLSRYKKDQVDPNWYRKFNFSYFPLPRSAFEGRCGLYRTILYIIKQEARNGMYGVFGNPDFNDLCKIWQVLESHRQERVEFRFPKELQIMGGKEIRIVHVACTLWVLLRSKRPNSWTKFRQKF